MATKPRMPPAGMMRNTPDDGAGAMMAQSQMGPGPAPTPAPVPATMQQEDQLYTEDEMKEHGLKCAILAKWDTVLRQVYWENAGDPKRQVVASTIYEIMVHFGFENPPEEGQQQETA